MTKITKKVEELDIEIVDPLAGKKKGEVIEYLIRESGYSYAEAEEYWSKNGARSKSRGFRAKFYAYLIANPDATEEESADFVKAYGSPNDIKAPKHWSAIYELVSAVRG